MSKIPDWALREDGSLGDTEMPKLDRAQEHFARLASERYERILELERSAIELSGHHAAKVAELEREIEREDRAHTQTITERDAAEEALSQAYFLIKGESPEWSNLFGHDEALEEIDDAQKLLRTENATLRAQLAEAQATIARLSWRPITETDLPKKGDETLNVTNWVMPVTIESQRWNAETWARNRWTHFRLINPAQEKQ